MWHNRISSVPVAPNTCSIPTWHRGFKDATLLKLRHRLKKTVARDLIPGLGIPYAKGRPKVKSKQINKGHWLVLPCSKFVL